MQQFGSLQNMMSAECRNSEPQVGMGATELRWTDRAAYTVIEIQAGGRVLRLQRDKAIRKNNRGVTNAQEYMYQPDPRGVIVTVSRRRDGKYRRVGEGNTGSVFMVGARQEYYDFTF